MRVLKQFVKGYLIGVALVAVVFLLTSAAHCAVGKKQSNSLGSVMYAENPLMYQAGFIAQGSDSVSDVDGNLNIRINPLETYMLYDESVLFCGLPVDMFQGKTEPFVLTYERVAHRQVRGVGCHELVAVHSLKTEKIQ
jgi:hypothetical protein